MAGLLEKTGDLVIVVAIIGVAWLLIQIKYFGFKKIKKNRNDMKLRFLEHASTAVILIVGLVVAFSTLGGVTFMVKSMLGGTAFFSAIIAFMAQDVVKDILAALMISIYQPFEIGDRIELEDGEAGVVEDVTMRHIVLVGQDTLRIVIPNRRLADMKIRNFSYNIDCRSRLFTFEIAYPSDVEFAIRVIKQAIMDSDYSIPGKKTKTGMEYGPVYFMAFESSSLLLKTMVYYLPSTSTEVMTTDINLRVDQALWENGIEIPYPHVNVLPTDPEVKDHRPNECPERVWKTPVIEMDTRDKEKMPLSLERALDETARLGQDNGLNKGEISRRTNGSLISMDTGTAVAYAIDHLQDRGKFFIYPQTEVYAGMVVGEHVHEKDLVINVTKTKQLTNVRASGTDEKARIIPPIELSLEEALEYIKEDEYVEVTPKSMRIRKIILDHLERKRANREE